MYIPGKSATFKFWSIGLNILVVFTLVLGGLPTTAAEAKGVKTPHTFSTTNKIGTGDGTWQWLTPAGQGNNLKTIVCPAGTTASDTVCYAAGEAGTILVTHDGGQNWLGQNSTTTENLTAISCFSATVCMAVGENQTVLTTSDGGQNWQRRLPNVTNLSYNGVSCPGLTTCFAATSKGLSWTKNGGATWQSYSSVTPVNTGFLNAISCPDTATCYAVGTGGHIFDTKDGGAHWTALTSGTTVELMGINCLTTTNCLVVGLGGLLLRGSDSGWTALNSTTHADLYGVQCLDANNCTLVGGGSHENILTTQDGGTTWQSQEVYAPILYGVSCRNNLVCYIVGRDGAILARANGLSTWITAHAFNSGEDNLGRLSCPTITTCFAIAGTKIKQTLDGGTTWTTIFTDPSSSLNDISCPDANNCMVVGFNAFVYSMSNGGSWGRKQFPDAGGFPSYTGVKCLSASLCYIVTPGGTHRFFQTTDLGGTLTPLAGGQFSLFALSCPSSDTCYVATQNNYIVKAVTSGGSATLTEGYTGLFNVGYSDISCPDLNNCYAVGSNVGDALGTHDGGQTWQALNITESAISNDIAAISCPATQVCYVADNGGQVTVTVDGGKTWISQTRLNNPNPDLNGITCLSISQCIAVGNGSATLKTADGNKTWVSQYQGVTNDIGGLACASDTTCFAAANTNLMLTTRDGGTSWLSQYYGGGRGYSFATGMSCPSATTCFATTGTSQIVLTNDGGQTWEDVKASANNSALVGLACPGALSCFAVGSQGTILAWQNGSWITQTSPVTFDLTSLSCPTNQRCYAIGNNGSQFVYYNGTSWQSGTLPGSVLPKAISCATAQDCMIATNDSHVLVTNQGGASWQIKQPGTVSALTDIACPTASECVTVGIKGQIASTTDNGQTWVKHFSGTKQDLAKVVCRSASACLVAGQHGVVLAGRVASAQVIGSSTDNGQGDTFGTLSYALKNGRSGEQISFTTATVFLPAGTNLLVPSGVNLNGDCASKITLSSSAGSQLRLPGDSALTGLNLTGVKLGVANQGPGPVRPSCITVKQ